MGFSRLYARKLLILVATIGITVTPSFVFGLGLGAIKLNSSLSEILNAEIDLIAATANDVSDLKVKLASREAFLRAGIERTGLLNTLRFKVQRRNNGKYFIKITSRKPIREPFLNFLLEINWKNGRMLREYTMLIDPPGRRVQQAQQSTIQAPQTAAPEVVAEPVQPVVEESPFKDEAPAQPAPVAKQDADAAYINDKELFPHRPVDEVEAPKEPEAAVEKVADPEPVVVAETVPEPEPVIPETVPEPEPEPVIVDDSKGLSGDVRAEHAGSGQVIEDKDVAKGEAFGEGELFPTIPLTEYDASKSIKYDEEPVEPVAEPMEADVAEAVADEQPVPEEELMGGPDAMESGNLDYGITKKSDNLWSIANRMKGDDATVYQVMMALLKSNPNAFTDGNIHRLKVGQVLRIDDPGLITAISKEQAAQDYMAQTEAWDAYRQQVAASAEEQPLSTGQVDSAPDDSVAAAPSGELTLSAPEGEDLSAASTPSQDSANEEVARLRDELQRITQQADAERGKNSALNDRLRELESEIESMQRTLSVRNDELAALQQQQATKPDEVAPAVAEPAPEPVQAPEPVAEAPAETAPAPQLEDEPAPVEEAATPVEQPAEESVAEAQTETAEAPVDTVTETEAPAPVEAAVPVEDAPAPPSTSLVDTIMGTVMGILKPVLGSSLLLFIGVPVLVIVVVLLVILMVRKRSTAKENFQESILSGAAPVDDEPAVSVSSQNSSDTSSFLSDFAISGVGAIQTEDSEVDPLTEADVFMAYGRYEAAEERLQEAIAADPNRNELKVKLLEVYNTNKNQGAFESTAEDLYASLGDDAASDSNWQKVVVMGKQIAPDNPIFSGSPTITSETTESVLGEMEQNRSDVSMTDSQVMDIGLETGVFSADELSPESPVEEADTVAATESDMGALDFNLGDDAPVTDQQETMDNITAPDADGLDFNLGGDEEVTEAAEPAEEAAMDFNLDLDSADDESTKSMAIDLNAMGLGDTATTDTTDDEDTASMAFDADALDLDSTSAQLDTGALDFSMDTEEAGDSEMDLNLDAGDAMDMSLSADSDEVGTKLDLAKAYIDMGDSSGAKSILDEVLDEGNEEQKAEAQQLVSQLS